MSLEYKTQVYIRKWIRQAEFFRSGQGVWTASLPAFGLESTGESQDDAEQNLLILLAMYVWGAPQKGWELPPVEGVSLGEEVSTPDPEVVALDAIAEHAASEYRAGRTVSLRDFAERNSIALDAV